MDRETELAEFERFHFRGHWDEDGSQMIAAIRRAAGNENIPVRPMPWWFFRLASPFNETFRELYATRSLWTRQFNWTIPGWCVFSEMSRIHHYKQLWKRHFVA